MFSVMIFSCFACVTFAEMRTNLNTRIDENVRMYHGQDFNRGDFPWLVALINLQIQPASFFCGGTLISSRHVVTAAHCIDEDKTYERRPAREIQAIFGAHDLDNRFETGRIEVSPHKVRVHSDWYNRSLKKFDADIALLTFDHDKITFSNVIQPISIFFESFKTYDKTTQIWVKCSPLSLSDENEGTVAGWGEREDGLMYREPKKITVPIHSLGDCLCDAPDLASFASKRHFCAGLQNGTGPCYGDSGSGFVVSVGRSFRLKGIVSASRVNTGICDVISRTLFTDVPKFSDWIDRMIQQDNTTVKEVCKNPANYCKMYECPSLEAVSSKVRELSEAVVVFHKNDPQHEMTCKGVLISEKFVLTVASCSGNEGRSIKSVRLGRKNVDDKIIEMEVKKTIPHPDFDRENKVNDIALLELENLVMFTEKIRPVCLNADATIVRRNLTQFTWSSAGIDGNEIEVKIDVIELPMGECRSLINRVSLDARHICAKNLHQDPNCENSTGDFLGLVKSGVQIVHGLKCFSKSCRANEPIVFTRVANYIDWIESVVWP